MVHVSTTLKNMLGYFFASHLVGLALCYISAWQSLCFIGTLNDGTSLPALIPIYLMTLMLLFASTVAFLRFLCCRPKTCASPAAHSSSISTTISTNPLPHASELAHRTAAFETNAEKPTTTPTPAAVEEEAEAALGRQREETEAYVAQLKKDAIMTKDCSCYLALFCHVVFLLCAFVRYCCSDDVWRYKHHVWERSRPHMVTLAVCWPLSTALLLVAVWSITQYERQVGQPLAVYGPAEEVTVEVTNAPY